MFINRQADSNSKTTFHCNTHHVLSTQNQLQNRRNCAHHLQLRQLSHQSSVDCALLTRAVTGEHLLLTRLSIRRHQCVTHNRK